MENNPLVSIVIPTKNRHEKLKVAVESVLKQSYKNFEIIVVDDGSDKLVNFDTLFKIDELSKIKIIRNDLSVGGARARNIGIGVANGEYLSFLDDDDVYLENKLNILLGHLSKDLSLEFAWGKTIFVKDGREGFLVGRQDILTREKNIELLNVIHNNATLIKASVFKNLKFYERLTRYQDMQFNIELHSNFKGKFVDDFVCEWRVDYGTDQITFNGGVEKKNKDLIAFYNLIEYLKVINVFDKKNMSLYMIRYFMMMIKINKINGLVFALKNWHIYFWLPSYFVSRLNNKLYKTIKYGVNIR